MGEWVWVSGCLLADGDDCVSVDGTGNKCVLILRCCCCLDRITD